MQPGIYWLMTTYVYYLTVSLDEESKTGSAAWFQPSVSHELTVRWSAGAANSEDLARPEGPTFKMIPSPSCGQETSVPCLRGLSTGLLPTWLHPEQGIGEREEEDEHLRWNL